MDTSARLGLAKLGLARLGLALAVSAAVHTPAFAQDQEAELVLEEVVVTARKIEESLLDAPLSVSAFSGDQLSLAGLTDISEVSFLTPGFSMQSNSRVNEQPFIRGMSVNSFFRPSQLTSSFIDGIYVQGMGRTVDFNTELERLEVVKGPQSALFGRATFAGAINYITRSPGDEPELEALLTAGSNDRYEASLWASAPLGDMFAVGVNLRYNDYRGMFSDASSGDPIQDRETQSGSVKLVFTPSDNFDATLRYEHTEFDDGHTANVLIGADQLNFNAGGTFDVFKGVLPVPGQNTVDINTEDIDGGFRRLDSDRTHLIMNWDIGDFTLTSATHAAEQTFDYYLDGDVTPIAAFGGLFHSRFTEEFDDFSQELRIAPSDPGRVRWLAGIYYYDGEYIISQLEANNVPGDPRLEKSIAVFGSIEFDLNDQWGLVLDARWQDEEIRRRDADTGAIFRDATTDDFLPRAIVNYRPDDDTLFYGSISKGNQPADFNTGVNVPPEFENIDEQTLWNYELGYKADFADGRYRVNGALFYIDWDGQPSRFVTIGEDGNVSNVLINAGNTEIWGVEATFEALLTERLRLLATYAFVDAEYQNFESVNCERAFGDASCDGKKVQNVPENQASLSLNYDFPISGRWNGFARGDIAYRDRQFVDEINLAEAPSATLANAQIGASSDRVSVWFWVRNLTDEDSPEFATRFLDLTVFPFNTGYQLALRTEREYGISLRYTY